MLKNYFKIAVKVLLRRKFFTTIPNFPFQEGSSLSAGNINYNSLKAMKALKMLEELEERFPVNR